ncbi:hypothetical protein GOP47_0022724 [Adiantum capillus-veneris]|uniref:Uncharacterized protein n=1 Tax=Adiantum capillus-veneris TaxID=13818 RepID=A0A9D4Z5S8_ADICA|nr:hypothetical protein GOP47_0022724 [Adiantum capillus-veneris]
MLRKQGALPSLWAVSDQQEQCYFLLTQPRLGTFVCPAFQEKRSVDAEVFSNRAMWVERNIPLTFAMGLLKFG